MLEYRKTGVLEGSLDNEGFQKSIYLEPLLIRKHSVVGFDTELLKVPP